MRAARGFWGVLALIELGVVLLHLPSFRLPHGEGDEVVFVFLAERLAENPLRYHVQGALEGAAARRFIADTWAHLYVPDQSDARQGALREYFATLTRAELLYEPLPGARRHAYDPGVYDRPLFVHPPLYPYTLSLFRRSFSTAGGPLLSILLHAATVAMVALLGRWWAGDRVGLIAGVLVAIDPVSWLCGSRLWIDGMAEAMATAAVLAATRAAASERDLRFALAGFVLGLACWTKLIVVVIAPAVVTTWLIASRRPPARRMVIAGACAAATVGVWLVISRVVGGEWIATPRPTPWILAQNPYVQFVVGRSWHFYLTGLVLVAPVLVYCVPGLLGVRAAPWRWVPAVWAGSTLAALTLVSGVGQGGGYQLRYIAPALPPLCLLAAAGIAQRRVWWWWAPAVLLGLLTFHSGFETAADDGMADPFPYLVAAGLDRLGYDLSRVAPGIW